MDESKLKAEAVMLLVNNIVGAFESGFIDSHTFTISELYRVAQNHVKDNYGVDVKSLNEEWGDGVAHGCKMGADLPSTDKFMDEEWGYVLPDNRVLSGGWKTPNDAIAGMEKRLGREAFEFEDGDDDQFDELAAAAKAHGKKCAIQWHRSTDGQQAYC